jgi:hypothetical protein
MESAWWGLLGTFVGAAASIATTAITSRNSVLLQVAAARRESLEKHRNFQRETLLELQDAVHDEMRAATKAYLHDGREFRKTGEWGRSLLGEELNQHAAEASRRTALLLERVASDNVRSRVKEAKAAAHQVLMARDSVTAEEVFARMGDEGQRAIEHIGQALRSLYVDEDAPPRLR